MKKFSLVLFLLLGCSGSHRRAAFATQDLSTDKHGAARTSIAVPTNKEQAVSAATKGAAYALSVGSSNLDYCDNAGPHSMDLSSGAVTNGAQACKRSEGVAACDDEAREISTRTPMGGPIDIIDGPDGMSYPQTGLMHDCVIRGNTMLVGTGSSVVLIDFKLDKSRTLSKDGSDHVVTNGAWAAWANWNRVVAVPLR